MITVTMNTGRLKLTVNGHAMPEESADYSQICAAASALAQSLAWSISQYNGGNGAMKSFEYRPDVGNLLIRVFPESWAERALRERFKIYGDGFALLAMSHPQSVKFILDGEAILGEKGEKEQ